MTYVRYGSLCRRILTIYQTNHNSIEFLALRYVMRCAHHVDMIVYPYEQKLYWKIIAQTLFKFNIITQNYPNRNALLRTCAVMLLPEGYHYSDITTVGVCKTILKTRLVCGFFLIFYTANFLQNQYLLMLCLEYFTYNNSLILW